MKAYFQVLDFNIFLKI